MSTSTSKARFDGATRQAQPFRTSLYGAISLAVVLLLVLAQGAEVSFYFAAFLAVAAAVTVQRSNRGHDWAKMITVFFWLAAGHAIYGYWAAGGSRESIWIGTNAEQMFRRAMLVVAATLLVAALTYDVVSRFPGRWTQRFERRVQVSDSRLIFLARCLLVLGLLCILYVVTTAGYMPILAADPGTARYISEDLGPDYLKYDWVLHKGLDLLACSIPLVLYSGLIYRRKRDWLIGALGILGIALTLERSYIISVFVVLLLTISFIQGKFPRKFLAFLMILASAYLGSQLIFLNALGENSQVGAAKNAVLSGLPEVRDLGWTMSLAGQDRYYGATFVEPLVLGPGVATNFREHYGLGNITASLIGMPRSETGGLRITLAGEGYLNFGAAGCLVVGIAFGVLCATLSHLSRALLKHRTLGSSYLVAVLFAWICFWLYLAGTESTGVLKNGLTFVFVLFFFARRRHLKKVERVTV